VIKLKTLIQFSGYRLRNSTFSFGMFCKDGFRTIKTMYCLVSWLLLLYCHCLPWSMENSTLICVMSGLVGGVHSRRVSSILIERRTAESQGWERAALRSKHIMRRLWGSGSSHHHLSTLQMGSSWHKLDLFTGEVRKQIRDYFSWLLIIVVDNWLF